MKISKPKFIKDWKNSWKYQSTQIQIWGSVLGYLWYQNPDIQAMLPPEWVQKFQPIIGLIVILTRITQFVKENPIQEIKDSVTALKEEKKSPEELQKDVQGIIDLLKPYLPKEGQTQEKEK